MTEMYFLRHGKTKVDPDTAISKWVLSDFGLEQAKAISDRPEFQSFDVIIASGEEKALQTAEPIATRLGKEIVRYDEISELDRDKGGFMNAEEYEATVKEALTNLDVSVRNWETAAHALERFSKKIEEIEKEHSGKKILIVGHGFTMNLYFAKLLGELGRMPERMEENDFCDWGIVEDGKVTKDLGK